MSKFMICYEIGTIDFLLLVNVMRQIDGEHIENVNHIDERVCMARIRPTLLDEKNFTQKYSLEFDTIHNRTLFNLKYGTNYQ